MTSAQSVAATLVALAGFAVGAASAQEQPPTKDDMPSAQAASKTRPHPRRRSVQQIIATVPPPAVAPSWGPVLAPPAAPTPIPAPAAGLAPVYPPPPATINSCTGGLCTDSSGATYNTGTGNAAINSQGRLCNRVGNTMQCF